MDIQVWADYQCPYCMIGKKRLYKAPEMNIDYVPYYMSGGVYLFSGDLTLEQYKDGLKGLIQADGI